MDTLTNFTIGADKIDLLTAVNAAVASPTSLTRVADVATSDDLSTALSTAFGSIGANSAGLVVISAGTAAGSYLYVNDSSATYSADADLFFKLAGLTTPLGAVGALTVGDFFA